MSKEIKEMIRGRTVHITGKPTFIFGGEFHYFRIPPSLWQDRLKKAKAAFLNTIGVYIPWNIHAHIHQHNGCSMSENVKSHFYADPQKSPDNSTWQ